MTKPLPTHHDFGTISNEDAVTGKRLKAWKPKKWRIEYERMVAMSCLGMSNKMIAKEVGYTKEHVSTILNMDEAENVRMMVLEKMRNATVNVDIPARLNSIAQKTVALLDKCFDDEDIVKKSPFALIDRGTDVLKGIGHLKTGGNGSERGGMIINSGGGNVLVLQGEQADSLAEALKRSDEVRMLHAGTPAAEPIEIVKAVEVTVK